LVEWVIRWLRWLAALGSILLVSGRLLAMPSIRRAWLIAPYSVGLWLEQQGYSSLSEGALTFVKQEAPDWAMPHLSLGNLYLRQGQLDRAEIELRQALSLSAEIAEAYNSLGLLYAARDDWTTATKAFRQALAIEPGQATVNGNLAFNLQMTGQRKEALRYYAMARSLGASHPIPLTNEAIARYETGDLVTTEAVARQAIRRYDAPAPAYTVLAAVALEQQRYRAVMTLSVKAIHQESTYIPAYFFLGLAAKALHQPDLAIDAFERVLVLDPDPLACREARLHLRELYARDSGDARYHPPLQTKKGGEYIPTTLYKLDTHP
jgi:Tfp pilus assembly protein PilF